MSTIRPRFETHKLEGTFTKTIYKPSVGEDGKPIGGFDTATEEQDCGWMVYFPSGASIHVQTEKELKRLGFDTVSELVDMDSGDVVGKLSDTSLRSLSEQKTSRGRATRPSIKQTGANGV